ncbi:MAG: hypothetical protein J7M14_06220, partial [Planctomycetes bacterium]|nr:hypothetical protein [Planctomycetota bacterium]
ECDMKRRISMPTGTILREALVAASLVLFMASATGCERREANEATGFDPKIDAPASSLRVVVDPNVAANQERISADMLERRSLAEPEVKAPEPEAAEQPQEEPKPVRRSRSRSHRTRRR